MRVRTAVPRGSSTPSSLTSTRNQARVGAEADVVRVAVPGAGVQDGAGIDDAVAGVGGVEGDASGQIFILGAGKGKNGRVPLHEESQVGHVLEVAAGQYRNTNLAIQGIRRTAIGGELQAGWITGAHCYLAGKLPYGDIVEAILEIVGSLRSKEELAGLLVANDYGEGHITGTIFQAEA